MKHPWEWSQPDLVEMISSEQEESLHLEFKASEALQKTEGAKKEISKDISAFANSDGGTIIYGMVEKNHIAHEIDNGVDADAFSKEWLEQVINSRIQPRIEGIRINPISVSGSRNIYCVYIPKSTRPHQAADKRFYKRFNFQSVPMEEYEIRDIYNRQEKPQVTAKTSLSGEHLSFRLCNIGQIPAYQVYLELLVPADAIAGMRWDIIYKTDKAMFKGKAHNLYRYHLRNETGPIPLFPGTEFEVLDGNFRWINISAQKIGDGLSWKIFADKAEPLNGRISIRQLRNQ